MALTAGALASRLRTAVTTGARPNMTDVPVLGPLVHTGSDNKPFLIAGLHALDALAKHDAAKLARIAALLVEYFAAEPHGADEQDSLNEYLAWRECSLFVCAAACGAVEPARSLARRNFRALAGRIGLMAFPVPVRRSDYSIADAFPGVVVASGAGVAQSVAVVFPGRRSAVDGTLGHLDSTAPGTIGQQMAQRPNWESIAPDSFAGSVVPAACRRFDVPPWLLDEAESIVVSGLLVEWPKRASDIASALAWARESPARFPVLVRYYQRGVAAILTRATGSSTDSVALHAACSDGRRWLASPEDGQRDTRIQGGHEARWLDSHRALLTSRESVGGGREVRVDLPAAAFGEPVWDVTLDDSAPPPVEEPEPIPPPAPPAPPPPAAEPEKRPAPPRRGRELYHRLVFAVFAAALILTALLVRGCGS